MIAARDPNLPAVLRHSVAAAAGAARIDPFAANAIRGLAAFDDPATPPFLREIYPRLVPEAKRAALSTLSSRPAGAAALLDAMHAGEIATVDLTADLARQIRNLGDARLSARLAEVWGTVAETDVDRQNAIRAWARKLDPRDNGADVAPDRTAGKALFTKTCGQCHELFGEGGKIGPGLTGSNRRDLDYLLSNVLAPSAVMAKDYRPTVLLTADGRVLTGLIRAETDAAITLATADGDAVVPLAEVLERAESDTSMMPDGLLNPLSTEQVRDLFAYLRGDGSAE